MTASDRPRVLMFAQRLPPAIGGVERHVAGLTHALSQRGYQITLVAPSHAPNLPEEEQINDCHILRVPHTRRRRYVRSWRWWMTRRQLLARSDIIHFHGVYTALHWFGPLYSLCLNKPRYLTFHGYEMRYPIPRRARLYRWLAAHLVHGSICIGHFLIKWFNLRPCAVTYGAVTMPATITPPPPEPHGVFVGRLDKDTGLDIYLRGLGILRREHSLCLPLTVCGDGPLRGHLERLASSESVRVNFVGLTAHPEQYLAKATIALASGYQSMLEAMVCRLPVFSVYHTPVKADYLRMVPNASRMFAIAGTPRELAVQLSDFLSNPQAHDRQLEQAYQFAARHTWSQLAETYTRLWELT